MASGTTAYKPLHISLSNHTTQTNVNIFNFKIVEAAASKKKTTDWGEIALIHIDFCVIYSMENNVNLTVPILEHFLHYLSM